MGGLGPSRGVARSPLGPVAVAPEAEVERHRREDRGAERAGCGEGVPLPTGKGSGKPPPQKIFRFELKNASFGASLVQFFAVD